jgi:hypothetical protein
MPTRKTWSTSEASFRYLAEHEQVGYLAGHEQFGLARLGAPARMDALRLVEEVQGENGRVAKGVKRQAMPGKATLLGSGASPTLPAVCRRGAHPVCASKRHPP